MNWNIRKRFFLSHLLRSANYFVAVKRISLFLSIVSIPSSGSGSNNLILRTPPKPTITIYDITSTKLKIDGDYRSKQTKTDSVGFIYTNNDTEEEITKEIVTDTGSGGSSFNYILRDLSCNTEYTFKAYASNSKDTTYSDEVTVTTDKCSNTTDSDNNEEDTEEEEEQEEDTTPPEVSFHFNNELDYGQTDESIKELQRLLNLLGFTVSNTGPGSLGNETNYYGLLTKEAVTKLQSALNITPPNGRVGPQTLSIINLLKIIVDMGLWE
jgi:hypothetical protein